MKLIAFSEALLEFHRDAQRAKIYLQDKRITNNERKILHAWYALKDSKHEEALELVESIPESEYPLIYAQAQLIKGVACNNSGAFKKAADYLEDSARLIGKEAPPELRFIPLYNLFITYFNLSSGQDMERVLKELDKIKTSIPRQQLCRQQCTLNLAVFHESDEVPELIAELDARLPEMAPAMAMTHLTTAFMFWIKKEEFKKAQKTLERIKSYRMFRSTANYNFMKVLLDHLMTKKPIYINLERFQDSEYLFSQVKVIEALERNEYEEASRFWARLSDMDPQRHGKNFEYHGQKGLFSLCLDLHLPRHLKGPDITDLPSDKLEALAFILKNSSTPVGKNQIYAYIYGHEPQNSQDDNRLRNLIFQARRKYGESIKFKKGCYFWVENGKKAS